MKKLILGVVSLLLFFAVQASPVCASAEDFTVKDFQADYYLDKDGQGFATLKTVERITATFPASGQNHGIRRNIPTKYNNHHTLDLDVQSVKNELGGNINYSKSKKDDDLVLKIGDADKYVHGDNVYVITYTQKYVIKSFSQDEFYWDVNGNDWLQSFSSVTARLHLSDKLAGSATNSLACYYGAIGSDKKCNIENSNGVIHANATNLSISEGMSIVVGFEKGTFKDYTGTIFDDIIKNIAMIESVILGLLVLILLIIKIAFDRSEPGRTTIIAEYLPPEGMDIPLIAQLYGQKNAWIAATLIDLVVRRNVKITSRDKGLFYRKKYTIELLSLNALSSIETHFLQAFFKGTLSIGDKYEMGSSQQDTWLSSSLNDTKIDATLRANDGGYYIDRSDLHKKMTWVAVLVVVQAGLIGYFFQYQNSFITIAVVAAMSLVFSLSIIFFGMPLSSKGSEYRDYMKGLKLYIKTAEADRIKILQSPRGAQDNGMDVSNKQTVINLYERLLPFAILFGLEKDWIGVLSVYYSGENMSPDWYSSDRPFESSDFAHDISSFSSVSSVSAIFYSGSSSSDSSSSSGFSSGGGFSGGGGGGGGGGGW